MRGELVVSRFRTQGTAALLAYLAYHRDRAHSRETLIELIWPRRERASGRNSLSHALSSLRRQLEPPGVARGSVIVAGRHDVQLDPASTTTDVAAMESALESAARAGSLRVPLLEEAVLLYRGELLPGFDEPWIEPVRERLRAALGRTVRALAAEHRKAGALDRALEHLRRGAAAAPLDEPLQRDLMALLAEVGQPLAAVRHYQELARRLKRDVSRLPGPETRELARRLEQASAKRNTPPLAERAASPATPAPTTPGGVVAVLLLAPASGGASARLRAAVPEVVREHGGELDPGDGEALVASFARPSRALACALAIQDALAEGGTAPPSVRAALDIREVETGAPGRPEHAERLLLAARAGQLLCSEPAAVLLRGTPGADVLDRGSFRLAGLAAPLRILEVRRPDTAWPAVPIAAERAGNPSLPLALGRFFGREAELERLRRELGPGGPRLVTVTGAGGMGKTRLAIEAARELLEPFAGSVAFVPLADVTAAREIPRAIAEALRLPPAPGLDPLARIADELSKRPWLLVLDNLEHLVPEGTGTIRALLERASDLRCLATSRHRLGLEGERELTLDPLPLPGASLEPEHLVEAPSVRLFAECARAVQPDFQVTRANAGAVSELVRRLEGIPLALTLAGRRAQALSLEQMLLRLSERLDIPAGRSSDAPSRHRTLRAAIEWSHALLSPPRQKLFARLSVFRGGFSVEAVRKVCDEPAALEELIALRECSLVAVEREAPEPRFRMLETLREFARDQLSATELAGLERRHAEHFRALAATSAAELDGPEHPRILDRLVVELDNLRAALDWSAADRSRSDTELELCASLWRVWAIRGPGDEGRRRCAAALDRSRSATPLRLRTLLGATTLASHQGDHGAARTLGEATLALAEELGDRPGILRALVILGGVETVAGSVEEACGHYEGALALARELGERSAVSGVLLNLGSILLQRGEPAAARRHLEESLSVSGAAQPMRTAQTLCELGVATLLSGEHGPAREHLERALAAFRALRYPPGVVASLRNLAHLAEREGNLERARSRFEESLAEARGEESWVGAQRALSLAGLARVSAPASRSLELLHEAMALARTNEVMRDYVEGAIWKDLGDLHRREGDARAARTAYAESLSRLAVLGEKAQTVSCLEGLAALLRTEGSAERAAELLSAASAARTDTGALPAAAEAGWLAAEREALREALGRRAFDRAWRAGGALALREAVSRALRE